MEKSAVNYNCICNTLLNVTLRHVSAFIENHHQAL